MRDGMVTLREYHEHRNAVSTSRLISDLCAIAGWTSWIWPNTGRGKPGAGVSS